MTKNQKTAHELEIITETIDDLKQEIEDIKRRVLGDEEEL